jgi:hypothetical protein
VWFVLTKINGLIIKTSIKQKKTPGIIRALACIAAPAWFPILTAVMQIKTRINKKARSRTIDKKKR